MADPTEVLSAFPTDEQSALKNVTGAVGQRTSFSFIIDPEDDRVDNNMMYFDVFKYDIRQQFNSTFWANSPDLNDKERASINRAQDRSNTVLRDRRRHGTTVTSTHTTHNEYTRNDTGDITGVEENIIDQSLLGVFALPLPHNLSEITASDWNTGELGGLASAIYSQFGDTDFGIDGKKSGALAKGVNAAAAVKDALGAAGGAFWDILSKSGEEQQSAAAALAPAAAAIGEKFFLPKNSGGASVITSALGSISNPRVMTYFSKVQLKKHSYTWSFFPKSEQETRRIKNMIHDLKMHMLPAVAHKGSRFTFPDVFQIRFNTKLEKYMYIPNLCVLESVNVSYNSETGTSYFETTDGGYAPTQINIQLDFGEIIIDTKEREQYKFNEMGGRA